MKSVTDLGDSDKAFKNLQKDDIAIISDLITVLKKIDENKVSIELNPLLLDRVEEFLNKCLRSLDSRRYDSNDLKSSQKKSEKSGIEDAADDIGGRFNVFLSQISGNAERKEQLRKLSCFLQGELTTEEDCEYIRTILNCYLKKIKEL